MGQKTEILCENIEYIQETPITNAANIIDGSLSTYATADLADLTESVDAYLLAFTMYDDFTEKMPSNPFNRFRVELSFSTNQEVIFMSYMIDRQSPITDLASLITASEHPIAYAHVESIGGSGTIETAVLDYTEFLEDIGDYIEEDPTFIQRIGNVVIILGEGPYSVNIYDERIITEMVVPINKVVFGNDTLMDISSDTVDSQHLSFGYTAHDADGEQITGTNTNNCDTSNDTVDSSVLVSGYTAHNSSGNSIIGSMTNNGAYNIYISDKTDNKYIPEGYHNGNGSVSLAPGYAAPIIPENIKENVTILGVTGSYTGGGSTGNGIIYDSVDANGYPTEITVNGLAKIPSNFMYYSGATNPGSLLSKITISSDITSIGGYAFYGCKESVVDIKKSSGFTIGSHAFMSNSFLESINLPSDMTTIGPYTFSGCTNLDFDSLPSTLTTIDQYAFENCSSLSLTSLPSNITTLGVNCFKGCSSLALTSLPINLTSAPSNGFYGCSSMTLSSLPTFTTIGSTAFYGCNMTNISSITATTSIGANAFQLCTFSNKLKIFTPKIGTASSSSGSFKGCTTLKAVWISNTANYIYASSVANAPFNGCTNLTDIYTNASAKKSNWGTYWNYKASNSQITVHYDVSEEDFDALEIT